MGSTEERHGRFEKLKLEMFELVNIFGLDEDGRRHNATRM